MHNPPRRVLTGHNANGEAIVLSDGPVPSSMFEPIHNVEMFEFWNTAANPAPIAATESEPTTIVRRISPPANGTIVRICDFHPRGSKMSVSADGDLGAKSFEAFGDAGDSSWKPGAPHALMHRTETIDYGVVIEGEITLILDTSETVVGPGGIVIQRGTSHAWENRSDTVVRVAFILVDGKFDFELARSLYGAG